MDSIIVLQYKCIHQIGQLWMSSQHSNSRENTIIKCVNQHRKIYLKLYFADYPSIIIELNFICSHYSHSSIWLDSIKSRESPVFFPCTCIFPYSMNFWYSSQWILVEWLDIWIEQWKVEYNSIIGILSSILIIWLKWKWNYVVNNFFQIIPSVFIMNICVKLIHSVGVLILQTSN